MVTVLRPLSISELLDRTFYLYRNHFLVFVGITAIPQLAVLALRLAAAATMVGRPLGATNPAAILAGICSYIAIEISAAAITIAVSRYHLDQPVGIGSAFSLAKSSMLRVILITLAIGIAATIGLVFLIIPGVYLFLMWSLAVPVTVLEGGGLNVSTTRSKHLTKDSRGRIFVIYLLFLVLAWIVSLIFQIPLGVVIGVMRRGNVVGMLPMIQAVAAAGTFFSTSLVGPLATIAITLIYYDQRVRKEGFDLQLMMANLQGNTQAAAAATGVSQ
jgi:hypothetical protein